MRQPYFPLFVNIAGKKIIVAGGGKIALRRVRTLLKFGADICIISPEVCQEIAGLEKEGVIKLLYRKYQSGDVKGAFMVIAATDDADVNNLIKEECGQNDIPVNTADKKSRCDFYFPSVVLTDETVIGISSGGDDPSAVKKTRRKIEKTLGLDDEYK